MTIWSDWMYDCVIHELRTPISICCGYLRWMKKGVNSDGSPLGGAKVADMAREAERGLARALLLVDTLAPVMKGERIAEILRALAGLFSPLVNLTITADAEEVACPNDAVKPVLWMLVQSVVRWRHDEAIEGEARAYIKASIDGHNCC